MSSWLSIPLPPLAVFILENTTELQNLFKKNETYILGLFYICSHVSTLWLQVKSLLANGKCSVTVEMIGELRNIDKLFVSSITNILLGTDPLLCVGKSRID